MIDHVAVQVADVDDSVSFYTEVFGPIGIEELMRFGTTVGLGRDGFPHLWFSPAGGAETRELHLALAARSRAEVDGVHAAALARGAEVLHAPRLFPEYHPGYYGVFVRDLDGHNAEAVFHDWAVSGPGRA